MAVLVWFRNDLRISDNEALLRAIESGQEVIAIYCWDERQLGKTHHFGFERVRELKRRFLLECLNNLKMDLEMLEIPLFRLEGLSENSIILFVKEHTINQIYYQFEPAPEEIVVVKNLKKQLPNVEFKPFWSSFLLHPNDLPFEKEQIPASWTEFKNKVEKRVLIRPCFPIPTNTFNNQPIDNVSLIKQLDFNSIFIQSPNIQTNNNLSAYLALGRISPKQLYFELERFELQHSPNQTTQLLRYELFRKDYFQYLVYKHPNWIFRKSGFNKLDINYVNNSTLSDAWCNAKTGVPIVDACMNKLIQTGNLHNKERQILAHFLVKYLGLDWRLGAEWFESHLIDYDVYINYGNWNYYAGLGYESKNFYYLDIVEQAKEIDPQGKYIKHWLPALKPLPINKLFTPWKLTDLEQKKFNFKLGTDYPNPIIDLHKQLEINKKTYLDALDNQKRRVTGNIKLKRLGNKNN